MKVQLFIDTANTKISVKDRLFLIQNPDKHQQISPMRIDSIAITSAVQINIPAIKLAAEHEIPVFIYHRTGKLIAQIRSPDFMKHSRLRCLQLCFMNSVHGKKWASDQITQKINSQCLLLSRWSEKLPGIYDILADCCNSMRKNVQAIQALDLSHEGFSFALMGIEGTNSRIFSRHQSDNS